MFPAVSSQSSVVKQLYCEYFYSLSLFTSSFLFLRVKIQRLTPKLNIEYGILSDLNLRQQFLVEWKKYI